MAQRKKRRHATLEYLRIDMQHGTTHQHPQFWYSSPNRCTQSQKSHIYLLGKCVEGSGVAGGIVVNILTLSVCDAHLRLSGNCYTRSASIFPMPNRLSIGQQSESVPIIDEKMLKIIPTIIVIIHVLK